MRGPVTWCQMSRMSVSHCVMCQLQLTRSTLYVCCSDLSSDFDSDGHRNDCPPTHIEHTVLKKKTMSVQLNTAWSVAKRLKLVHNVWINRGWSQRGLGVGLRRPSERPPPPAWINTASWGTQIVSPPRNPTHWNLCVCVRSIVMGMCLYVGAS